MYANRRSDRVLRPSTTNKRKADGSPVKGPKRCALGDISNKANFPVGTVTNATRKKVEGGKKGAKGKAVVTVPKTRAGVKREASMGNVLAAEADAIAAGLSASSITSSPSEVDDSLYTTAAEISLSDETLSSAEDRDEGPEGEPSKGTCSWPEGVTDFDKECGDDPMQVGMYATDIFAYYKQRESQFPVQKYLGMQDGLNKSMRSILVDWLVEVQESFELNHETLYLAVKLVDLFLGKVQIKRDKLQLVGTTAFWIAAKYDERLAPAIDDFCYICDDAYSMGSIMKMEAQILKALDFDIGIPLSYRFLRRYARCAKLDMEMLTLARFILETSLMEYDFIDVVDSMMAAAALLLALCVNKVSTPWTPTLVHYSGYTLNDLFDLANRLLHMLKNPPSQVKTIKAKYSNSVFFAVSKILLPDQLKI